ncbi:MAG: hypothetical protein J4F28_01985 [Nitrosopumilaceae archaeon]|nr:hypothetical protein [Nitrosopumilaceae archaeon]
MPAKQNTVHRVVVELDDITYWTMYRLCAIVSPTPEKALAKDLASDAKEWVRKYHAGELDHQRNSAEAGN